MSVASDIPAPYRFPDAKPDLADDRVGELIGKQLRARLETAFRELMRAPVELRIGDAEWRAVDAQLAAVAVCDREGPVAWVEIMPAAVSQIVDRRFGGNGDHPVTVGPRPNASERATREQLGTSVAEAIGSALTLDGLTALPCGALWCDELMERPAPGLVVQFVADFPRGEPVEFSLRLAPALIGSIARPEPRNASACREWSETLARAARAIRFEARVVLARPTIPLSRLAALEEGDLLPIQIPPLVPLAIAGRRIARGELGEQDGVSVLRLQDIEGLQR